MEEIINMLIRDHEIFRKVLSSVGSELEKLNLKPKTPEEKFKLLREMIAITYRLSEFAGLSDNHRRIEEITVYPRLEELGFEEQVRELKNQHIRIVREINTLRRTLLEYKEGKKSIEEISEKVAKLFAKIKPMYLEHINFEEKLFPKLV